MLPVERQLHRLDGLEMPLQAEQDLTLPVRRGSLRFRNSHNLPSRVQTAFGIYKLPAGYRVDTTALQKIAEKTGGMFWKAEDADSLSDIYNKIDELEKSEIESIKYVDYNESFLPFALAALGLIGCEVILNCTVFRKIP